MNWSTQCVVRYFAIARVAFEVDSGQMVVFPGRLRTWNQTIQFDLAVCDTCARTCHSGVSRKRQSVACANKNENTFVISSDFLHLYEMRFTMSSHSHSTKCFCAFLSTFDFRMASPSHASSVRCALVWCDFACEMHCLNFYGWHRPCCTRQHSCKCSRRDA